MLQQKNAVRNLQYDVEIHTTHRLEATVIQQPTRRTVLEPPIDVAQSPRIPLPISVVSENSGLNRTYIPKTGYDFLIDLPSLHIEQTFELNESLTAVSSENRFVVRTTLGDAIYAANERPTSSILCGSAKGFQLHLLDKTHQEALVYLKKQALGYVCCQPTKLEVWIPPGDILGSVIQAPTFFQPEFYIEDSTGQPILCVEGPSNSGCFCFFLSKEAFFRVHSGGELRASIDHKWVASKGQYSTNIYFSDSKLTAKERALILGAAFLLEYKFFQTN